MADDPLAPPSPYGDSLLRLSVVLEPGAPSAFGARLLPETGNIERGESNLAMQSTGLSPTIGQRRRHG
jgi:hypothetical protein